MNYGRRVEHVMVAGDKSQVHIILCQDFSKILVVLGFEIQGGEVATPTRLMAKLIGLRIKNTCQCCYRSVQVGVRQNFVQHLFLGGEGAAREARGALAQIASCRA